MRTPTTSTPSPPTPRSCSSSLVGVKWLVLCVALSGCDLVLGLDRPPEPDGPWQSVAAGRTQTCALHTNGTLWCWGTGIDVLEAPTQIGDARWSMISIKHDHVCAIQNDASLWCWGDNLDGQLGDGTLTDRSAPVQIAGAWLVVSAGVFSTCAIRDSGVLACWGTDLGSSPTTSTLTPVDLRPDLAGWTAIDVSIEHACGMRDGELWCWGDSFNGRLGDENLTSSIDKPQRIGGDRWRAVSAGPTHSCAIREDGHLACWGDNSRGQLGVGTRITGFVPEVIGSATDWTSVVTAADHSCAVRAGTSLWCWGDNASGKHGVTTSAFDLAPVEIPHDRGWVAAAIGPDHLCAIDGKRHLFCAGARASGQLGDGTTHELAPIPIEGPAWTSLALRGTTACALDREGTSYCWGAGARGQIGDGAAESRQTPTRNGPRGGTQVVVGDDYACQLRSPSALWCWGNGSRGQIGNGASADAPLPVPAGVDFFAKYSRVAAGDHMCGIDTAGSMWCWGNNSNKQLSISWALSWNRPTRVYSGAPPWIAVAVAGVHTCAVSTGNELWCWGYVNQMMVHDVPSKVVTPFTGVAQVVTAPRHSCVWQTDGLAACWGDNMLGAVGAGTPRSMMPTQLTGTWHQLAVGEDHTCGIAVNRSLWCWGDNTHGQLGDGTRTMRASPTRIGTGTWDEVVAGARSTCARTGDALWCWGDNTDGQLGNARAWRSDFVEVF